MSLMTSANQPSSPERDSAVAAQTEHRASWQRPWRWITNFLFDKPPGFYAPVIPKGDGVSPTDRDPTA